MWDCWWNHWIINHFSWFSFNTLNGIYDWCAMLFPRSGESFFWNMFVWVFLSVDWSVLGYPCNRFFSRCVSIWSTLYMTAIVDFYFGMGLARRLVCPAVRGDDLLLIDIIWPSPCVFWDGLVVSLISRVSLQKKQHHHQQQLKTATVISTTTTTTTLKLSLYW